MKIKSIQLSYFMLTVISLVFVSGCIQQSTKISDLPTKPKKPLSTGVLQQGQSQEIKTIADKGQKKEKRQKKYFRDLTYEDFQESKVRLLSEGKKVTAIKHIEKMIPLCNNIQELRNLQIELSDLFFETGNLKRAEELYSQFSQLYPGDENIEYVTYKAILCNYWLTLDSQRDQSITRTTIDRSKKFLARLDVFDQYVDEVKKILVDSQSKILESEINVFRFYLNHGDELSAKTRLANMQKEFLEDMPQMEAQFIVLACELAQTFDRQEALIEKQTELATRFPNYQEELQLQQQGKQAIAIAENKKIPSFVDKF